METLQAITQIRLGITEAKADFGKLYSFYSGTYNTALFSAFLATGDFYLSPLSREAWRRTIFAEIARVDALLGAKAGAR